MAAGCWSALDFLKIGRCLAKETGPAEGDGFTGAGCAGRGAEGTRGARHCQQFVSPLMQEALHCGHSIRVTVDKRASSELAGARALLIMPYSMLGDKLAPTPIQTARDRRSYRLPRFHD